MSEVICKRCLLRDIPHNEYHKSVMKYRSSLSEAQKTTDAEYEARLELCTQCDQLANGVCAQCGCYVEMRASAKKMHCPPPWEKW